MRTNAEIDDQLLSQVIACSGAKTKKEAINEALKFYLYRMALQKLDELREPSSWEENNATIYQELLQGARSDSHFHVYQIVLDNTQFLQLPLPSSALKATQVYRCYKNNLGRI